MGSCVIPAAVATTRFSHNHLKKLLDLPDLWVQVVVKNLKRVLTTLFHLKRKSLKKVVVVI